MNLMLFDIFKTLLVCFSRNVLFLFKVHRRLFYFIEKNFDVFCLNFDLILEMK